LTPVVFAGSGILIASHYERSEAIYVSAYEVKMDCFAALAMTWKQRRNT
jgi:hypothetical protein